MVGFLIKRQSNKSQNNPNTSQTYDQKTSQTVTKTMVYLMGLNRTIIMEIKLYHVNIPENRETIPPAKEKTNIRSQKLGNVVIFRTHKS